MSLRDLREKKESYLRTSRNILERAETEKRGLTEAEARDFDGLLKKANALSDTLKRGAELSDMRDEMERSTMAPVSLRNGGGMRYESRQMNDGEVRVYAPDEAMAQAPYSGPGVGSVVRGIVTGKWASDELRDMVGGTPAAGGYLIPTPLSIQVIDLIRNQTQVVKAGAGSVAMESATLKMARLASDVASNWKAEDVAATFTDNSFEQVLFSAHTLFAGAKLSIELIEDSYNIDAIVSESISKSLALELDRACLYGSGAAPQPTGVKLITNVTLTNLGSTAGYTLTDYSKLSAGISTLLGLNFPGPFGVLYNARTAGELDNLQDTLHQPLRQPDLVAAARKFVTNQIPSNLTDGSANTTSDIFIGQWSELMIGMRTGITLEISREAADANSSAFANGQVWIRAYLRADVQALHPKAFNVLTGVL